MGEYEEKIVQATVTAMLVSSMVVCPVFAEPSIDDLKDNKAAVEGEVTSLQSQLTSILDKINTLESDLSKKQEEIEKANVDLEEAIVQQQKQFADMKNESSICMKREMEMNWRSFSPRKIFRI